MISRNSGISWRATLWRYAPLVLWIGVIFYMSSDQGSMSQTSRFIRPLLEFLFPNTPEQTLQTYHGYIRKSAHFAEYAMLAFLAWRVFAARSGNAVRITHYLLPIAIVAGVTAIDELNQSLSAARTGSVWDAMLDISGGAAMIAVIWLIRHRKRPAAQADSGNFMR